MADFGDNKPVNPASDFNDKTPVQFVLKLRKQGMSNYQIIQLMSREGYSQQQIYFALNQAELKGGVDNIPTNNPYQNQPYPQGPPQMPPNQFMPPQGMPPQMDMTPNESTEELVETIIEEKWNELMKDITRIIEWKNKTETRIAALDQQFKDLKDNFDKLHSAIVAKVGEYDQNILNVGTEIKAMEKVFQKVLPSFTDNVSELTRITQELKDMKTKR